MGTIKDKNDMDLTEAEDNRSRRSGKNRTEAEEVARIHRRTIQKKIFTTQIITMV